LKPLYLTKHAGSSLKTELFGVEYDAPFGIALVGLQGLIWPDYPRILATAAAAHNIAFVLSTVSTATIEEIAARTHGRALYQLCHPAENSLRDSLIKRADAAGYPVLVILSDVPTFGSGRGIFAMAWLCHRKCLLGIFCRSLGSRNGLSEP